jgi:hypothetical protein
MMPEWWGIPDYAAAEADTWIAQFSSKAYIARIGSTHGYSRLGIGGRVFAWLTDATFSEPFTKGQCFRLQTEGAIQCQASGSELIPRLKLSLTAGQEFGGFQGRVGARSSRRSLPLKDSHALELFELTEVVPRQQYAIDILVFGRPSPRLEPAFLLGGWRKCFYIWQKLSIRVNVSRFDRARPIAIRVDIVDCSRFPSHCLWAQGSVPLNHPTLNPETVTNEWQLVWCQAQRDFHSLWAPAPPPDDLEETFVRGIS